MATRATIISALEREQRFGIECRGPHGDDRIQFRAGEWVPGGEYVAKLIVRNVSTEMRKLKYRLPSTRYFSLAYPELIKLSPGTFTEIDIVFRPVQYEPYDDTVFFQMQEGAGSGGFHVRVEALISKLSVSVPRGLDLGFCPTAEVSQTTLEVQNTGEVDAPFRWDVPAPFVFEPKEGTVPVGQSTTVTVSIMPEQASVFVSNCTCHVGEGVRATIDEPVVRTAVSAIGKYAYVSLSETMMEFGDVLAGTPREEMTKDVLLRNPSVVPTTWVCERLETDRDPVFTIEPSRGVIEPESEISLRVSYDARTAGQFSVDNYEIATPGGHRVVLECRGNCVGPQVHLYKKEHPRQVGMGIPNSVNFRDVEVGQVSTRAIFLDNKSDLPARFCIMGERDGIFAVDRTYGVIAPQLGTHVQLRFAPAEPFNYYRRVFVLIEKQAPEFMDLLGSGYIPAKGEVKEQRPAPIRHAHIQAFRNRRVRGLSRLAPEELDEMYEAVQDGRLMDVTSLSALEATRDDFASPEATDEFGASRRRGTTDLDNSLDDPTDLFAKVGVDGTRILDPSLTARPLTRSAEATRNEVAAAAEFFVRPTDTSSEVLLSSEMLDFNFVDARAARRSNGAASAAGGGAGANSKNNGTARQHISVTNTTRSKVTVAWFVPPSVLAMNEKFYQASDNQRQLPEVIEEDEGHVSTATLWNEAYTSSSRDFRVSPSLADIAPSQTKSFTVAFCPRHENFYFNQELEAVVFPKNQRTFRLVNDATLAPPWHLPLRVVGHTFPHEQFLASVSIAVPGRKLTFPACHIGDNVYQTIRLSNSGNLPAEFRFNQDPDGVFEVRPATGLIPAEGFYLVCLQFRPRTARKYSFDLHCTINQSPANRAHVLLEGHGGVPSLAVLEAAPGMPVYLKPTCVGLVESRTITVQNTSRLPLSFSAELQSKAAGLVSLSPAGGTLRGNEKIKLTLAFAPREQRTYQFRLRIFLYAISGDAPDHHDARQIGVAKPARCIGKMNVILVLPADHAAVAFDPPQLEYDVRLVNTTQTKQLKLENLSDSAVRYELFHTQSLEPERGAEDGLASIRQDEAAVPQEGDDHLIVCDRPSGILPARSRALCNVTFQPHAAGKYTVHLSCQVAAVDAQGETIMLSSMESTLQRLSRKAVADAVSRHQQQQLESKAEGANQCGEGTDGGDDLPPLVCALVGRSCFPSLVVRDVRPESGHLGVHTRALWQSLSLSRLNADLRRPLTNAEVAMNSASSPDLSFLPRYKWEFTPNVMGAEPQVLLLELHNPGHLPAEFHITFPNEKELELEPWADEGDPTEQELMQVAIIEEIKCFSISPQHGKLEPGQSLPMRISYSYCSTRYNGVHRLPLFVKVMQGKQLWIDVCGTTLPGLKPLLHPCTAPESNCYELTPVALGTPHDEAPLQETEILNVSDVEVTFQIDTRPLVTLKDANYEWDVLRLMNPTGTIAPRSSHKLRWRFSPLEAKEYAVALAVRYQGGSVEKMHSDTMEIVLRTSGYDPRDSGLDPQFQEIPTVDRGIVPPPRQIFLLPGQLAVLSQERFLFGRVPQHTELHRMVVLRNVLPNSGIEFEWDQSNALVQRGFIQILPSSGKLPPQGHMAIQLHVDSRVNPILLDEIIMLRVTEVMNQPERRGRRGSASRLASRIRGSTRGNSTRGSIRASFGMSAGGERSPSPGTVRSATTGRTTDTAGSFRTSTARSSNRDDAMESVEAPVSYLHVRIEGEIVDIDTYKTLYPTRSNATEEEQQAQQREQERKASQPFDDATARATRPLLIPEASDFIAKSEQEDTSRPDSRGGGIHFLKRQEETRVVVKDVMTHLLQEIMISADMSEKLHALPENTTVPGFTSLAAKDPMVVRVHQAMKEACGIDVGTFEDEVTFADLHNMFTTLQTPTRKVAVRNELKSLLASADRTVSLRDFVTTLSKDVYEALEHALDKYEHESTHASVLQRKSPQVLREQEQAAARIQNIARQRAARQTVKQRRLSVRVQSNEDLREQHEASLRIQQVARGRRERVRASLMMEERAKNRANEAIAEDSDFRKILAGVLEQSVFQLMEDALDGQYRLDGPPARLLMKLNEG